MNREDTTATAGPPGSQTRKAVIDLLYRLADDNLVFGHRNSEWTGVAPILEADIAFSSMAQDKVGHAIAFYRILHELGEPDPDTLAFARPAEDFRCCSLATLDKGDWARSIVRQFLFDEATAVRLDALRDSGFAPIAKLARKLRGEVKYHVMHGRMWITRLGNSTEEGRKRMQSAFAEVFPHALGVFEPTRWDRVLADEGIQPSEADLCEVWQAAVSPILAEAGLSRPRNVEPYYGGRGGHHGRELTDLLDAMRKVYRLDPTAKW